MRYFQFLLLVFCTALVMNMANAANGKPSKVEIKCHVELMGGSDIIHFAIVSQQQLANIKQILAGQKVLTALSKQKQVIYKVNECVGLHDSFVSGPAKSRDILTTR